jgi:Spy/CpxP family protein refolding chaperone
MQFNETYVIRAVLIFLAVVAAAAAGLAQVPPDKDNLLNGEGAGQGMYAEAHGYPGPKHVLDMQKDLQLSDEQKKSVQNIFDEMKSRAKELGQAIVKIEVELNSAFADGMISEKSVRDDSEEIGRIRGKLRSVHLIAHIKTKKVLNETQLAKYKKMRADSKDEKVKK